MSYLNVHKKFLNFRSASNFLSPAGISTSGNWHHDALSLVCKQQRKKIYATQEAIQLHNSHKPVQYRPSVSQSLHRSDGKLTL